MAFLEIDHATKFFPDPDGRGQLCVFRDVAFGVVLEGREISGPGMDRMVVFQNFSLMPWMTVTQNVRLAVRSAYPSWPSRKIEEWVERYVEMVGLTGAENKRPSALSV